VDCFKFKAVRQGKYITKISGLFQIQGSETGKIHYKNLLTVPNSRQWNWENTLQKLVDCSKLKAVRLGKYITKIQQVKDWTVNEIKARCECTKFQAALLNWLTQVVSTTYYYFLVFHSSTHFLDFELYEKCIHDLIHRNLKAQ
jgi:hypothetical protein